MEYDSFLTVSVFVDGVLICERSVNSLGRTGRGNFLSEIRRTFVSKEGMSEKLMVAREDITCRQRGFESVVSYQATLPSSQLPANAKDRLRFGL